MISRNKPTSAGAAAAQRNGLPFLSAKDATHSPQPARLVTCRLERDQFRAGQSVVKMRIDYKGQHWTYNLRTSNPNLDVLCEAWGDDETKWLNRHFEIYTEEDDVDSKVWLRFAPIDEEENNPEEKYMQNDDEKEDKQPDQEPEPQPEPVAPNPKPAARRR